MNATSTQPKFAFPVYTRDLFGSPEARIQEVTDMLRQADQHIDRVEVVQQNGAGEILQSKVLHHPAFPVNDRVLEAARSQDVVTRELFGSPISKINNRVSMLKSAEQKILNVSVTHRNGAGEILAARIDHISQSTYNALI